MRTSDVENSSPYGDLQQEQLQHSTFAYDSETENQENKKRLLKKPTDTPDSESELAMAVVDILSCCDGRINPNQAKVLQDMGSRYHDNGNLIGRDEEKVEEFLDEYQKRETKGFSLNQLLHGFEKRGGKHLFRSSRSFVGSLRKDTDSVSSRMELTKKTASKKSYFVTVIVVFLLITIIILVAQLSKPRTIINNTSNGPADPEAELSHPTSDCSLLAEQKHPNPLSQCACDGSITVISQKAREKYDVFLQAFGAEYLHENESIDSCSARNQALVWLSEDKSSTLSDALFQRHTLVLFFIKLKGLGWTLEEGHQKWLTSDHECTWFGIGCDENKQVTAIELWDLNLDGAIPKEIMSLTSLERLSLPENKIKGHLPTDGFIMMTKMTDLTLFMNSISGPIDKELFNYLTKLQTLNIDSNEITGSIPSEIGKLSNLEELKLARNYIKGTLPTELGNLKLMRRMELEENNIYGTLPSEIGKIYPLLHLDLSWNNLGGSIPWELQGLRNMKDILLKSNDIQGTLPTIVDVWSNLENLVLSLNAFSGELPFGMEHMTTLSTLHIDGNKFNGTIPTALGSCSLLRDIRMDYNQFHGHIPTEIGQLAWLVSMSLEGNSFTGTMPAEVCNLRGDVGTLETLSATCTSVSDNDRDKEVFVRHNDFVCRVPDCCSSCEL